ncbi:MAG: thioredoxin domain-containing protein [Deinococcales bacterium]
MKHQANALIHETSPYLLQHAYNPVSWLPWGQEAFMAAKTRDVPILLSVGYSACHWCHVMERESFENVEIAEILNRSFVSIKVDREERPDVDTIYMNAVQMLSGSGGWPMTVFLTPEGKPFFGGTYYPPTDRYGRPGFMRVLRSVSDAWQHKREQLLESAEHLTQHLANFERVEKTSQLEPASLQKSLEQLERLFDPGYGGFGAAPKFPNPANLEWLLEHYASSRNPKALEMLQTTLTQMANGGIFDHLGGGFARYSTDERWLVPHFEKMLYDNAQLIKLYLLAHQVQPNTLYFLTAKESLEYTLREMQSPEGGFYSAQDADSEGVEGKFFVWSEAEIDALLLEDAALFKRAYGVTPYGNWEHQNILSRVATDADLAALDADFYVKLESCKTKLFLAREKRIKPGLDDKILCSWNGLMLEALALAGRLMGGRAAKYLAHAKRLAEFLLATFSYRDQNGFLRLYHTYKTGSSPKIHGLLEDYALLALGLLELYQSTFLPDYLKTAQQLAKSIAQYFTDANGGFFDTPSDAEALIVRPKSYFDGAMPSGNGASSILFLKLARLTTDPALEQIALEPILQMQQVMQRQPTGFGSLNRALEQALAPRREIALVGEFDSLQTQALLAVLQQTYMPHVAFAAGEIDLPLLEGRHGLTPQVFLCENMACQMPITDPEILKMALDGFGIGKNILR